MGGWIEHKGGEMPVSGDTRVTIRCVAEYLWIDGDNDTPVRADNFRWEHVGLGGNIVAYKVWDRDR